MKYLYRIIIGCSLAIIIFSCNNTNSAENSFSFTITSDWRQYSTEKYHNSEYFQGALEDIKRTGKGDFMISPGDVEPQYEALALIEEILGLDYPWYPAIGNHEIEDTAYVEWFREYNKNGNSLPNIVNVGPDGSEETTFSFDWKNGHFIILNEYYDGNSDMGTDGQIVPELMNWLEDDLKNTNKQFCFVIGHEPINSQPDMESGRVRHRGDSLDQYPVSTMEFFQLLKKYKVTAYIHGHNHSTSVCKLNGLWMIDAGHAKGTEEIFPKVLINQINQKIDTGISKENALKKVFYDNDPYYVKKTLYYMDLTNGLSYKVIDDEAGIESLNEFYNKSISSEKFLEDHNTIYFGKMLPTKSTYYRVNVNESNVMVDIYRKPFNSSIYEKVDSYILN